MYPQTHLSLPSENTSPSDLTLKLRDELVQIHVHEFRQRRLLILFDGEADHVGDLVPMAVPQSGVEQGLD